MDWVVRRIGVEDFEAVTGLLSELGRPAPTAETIERQRAVFGRHVADAATASLIAEIAGRAVGFLSLRFREQLNQVTFEAWIPDLIVTETARGSGVAAALFQEAVRLARAEGCHRIVLESGYQRERAHRFYGREGMSDAGKYFVMRLS